MTRHLLDLSLEDLEAELASWGEPAFRAKQIAQWALKHGATSFEEMTNLPASLRTRIAEAFDIATLPAITERAADDGATTKVLQIGRAHVRTPVTNAHIVCRLRLKKK